MIHSVLIGCHVSTRLPVRGWSGGNKTAETKWVYSEDEFSSMFSWSRDTKFASVPFGKYRCITKWDWLTIDLWNCRDVHIFRVLRFHKAYFAHNADPEFATVLAEWQQKPNICSALMFLWAHFNRVPMRLNGINKNSDNYDNNSHSCRPGISVNESIDWTSFIGNISITIWVFMKFIKPSILWSDLSKISYSLWKY